MKSEVIKFLQRAKELIKLEQYEGAITCIDLALDTVNKPIKTHCPNTCDEPGGYCMCKAELINGE
jgi:hypothetical protein